MQFDMFSIEDKEVIIDQDGKATYYPDFLENNYFDILKSQLDWRQDQITLFGKTHDVPRLQAWYGDKDAKYSYSGIQLDPLPWNETLLEIKKEIEASHGLSFNSCLCNLYRSGRDYASWHSDDEIELGQDPVIASISLGETRKIVFKHNFDKGVEKIEKDLADKSLLIMEGKLQHFWKHQLNKTAKKVGERINLTFRTIR